MADVMTLQAQNEGLKRLLAKAYDCLDEFYWLEAGLWNEMPRCPITQDPMRTPVMLPDGFVYEREAICNWIETCIASGNPPSSPLTREVWTQDPVMLAIYFPKHLSIIWKDAAAKKIYAAFRAFRARQQQKVAAARTIQRFCLALCARQRLMQTVHRVDNCVRVVYRGHVYVLL